MNSHYAWLLPTCQPRANQTAAIQQVLEATFDDVAFAAVQVGWIGGELTWLGHHMKSDLFPACVMKTQEPRFLPNPDLASNIFRGCRVISAFELNVAIAMHRAARFLEDRKQAGWQRLQGRALHLFKKLAHLLASRAVDACISHIFFPV